MRIKTLVWCGLALAALCSVQVAAMPQFLAAWQNRYPTSTIPTRMEAMFGSPCFTCHHPPAFDLSGNCYKHDLRELVLSGMTIEDALEELDAEDSDGDGFGNGEEITLPRTDLPGEVGYSMGLIGDGGTDPCALDPNEEVTGIPETPGVELIGDCDGDGSFSLRRDLPCFISVLLGENQDQGSIDRSDTNRDGETDGLDISKFLDCALNGC